MDSRSESYEEATARLLRVEWGVTTLVRTVLSFFYFAPNGNSCENELCALLAGRYDGPLAPSPQHAHGLRWATLAECAAELEHGTPAIHALGGDRHRAPTGIVRAMVGVCRG